MLDIKTLGFVIKGLHKPAQLDDHPLTSAQFVIDFLREHPDKQPLPPGKRLGWALADLWLTCYRPPRIAPEDWNKWNTFLSLEGGYFYPFRHNAPFPGNPAQIGRALSDPEYVAEVIADHDAVQISELRQKKYEDFWQKVLPPKDEAILPTTARSRLLKAMELLLQKLQEEPIPHADAPRATRLEAHEQSSDPDSTPIVAPEPLQSVVQTTGPVSATPFALAAYQALIDRQYPALAGYRPPMCRYDLLGQRQQVKDQADAQLLLEKHQTVLVTGETGIGKTTYLTQVLVPASRQLGLIPIVVSLSAYFDAREKVGDLASFVREKVFGHWQPDAADRDAFARELAEAVRDQRAVWLLDGYDELTPRERGLLNQELEREERWALTTRQVRPEARRPIEVTLQLTHIGRNDALEYVGTRYSANVRSRIETWCTRHTAATNALTSGWWLAETARLADDPSQVLSLATVLEKAISRQLSARARFQISTSADVYALARNTLGNLAFDSLSPKWRSGKDPDRFSRAQLILAWRNRSAEPEALFFEVIGSTGLLLEDGERWRFPNEFVRDKLAAEFIQSEDFMLSGRALYPQFERPLSFWAARLLEARQPQRVVDLLTILRDLIDDPYGARWSMIVRILSECRPFDHSRLHAVQLETEQVLWEWQRATSSTRMKRQINSWLIAIGSDQIPERSNIVGENALRNLDTTRPQLELPELMEWAGHADLARRLAEGGRVDQQAVTHVLIDIIIDDPGGMITDAAVYLTQRNLEPTMLDELRKEGPIDRLVDLARTRPVNPDMTDRDFNRAQAAQSAALGILGRPVVLTNESLLKRIPDDVIHTLMVDLNLRVRKADNRITVITADGREWQA